MKTANATLGESITFNQTTFATGNQWADKGILYVPKNCEQKQCKLHIILHDCGTRDLPSLPPADQLSIEEQEFAKYAEANDIVLLLPRLSKINDVKIDV